MTKFFIDSDVIIDLLMERDPFIHSARHVFGMIEARKARGYTSAVVLANVYYLLSKYLAKDKALNYLKTLISILEIIPINHENVVSAIDNPGKDFEDSLQLNAAESFGCSYIVTRNIKDYSRNGKCKPILPEQALRIMSQ